MERKKLTLLWSGAAALLFAGAVVLLALGIRAGVLKEARADFAVDVSQTSVAAVYEAEGYYAVADDTGKISCYGEENTEEPLFTYDTGAEVTALAISGGRLYAVDRTSRGFVYAFSLEASGDKAPDTVYRTDILPSRLYIGEGSDYFAVAGGYGGNTEVHFLRKEARGENQYSVNYLENQGASGLVLAGDLVYYSSGQRIYRAGLNESGDALRPDPDFSRSFNRNILGILAAEDGFAAIDSGGNVMLFDSAFTAREEYSSGVADIGTAFASGELFVCKLSNGGIAGVHCREGKIFSVASGNDSILVYVSPESFAYLTEDGGDFRYYTLQAAKDAQHYASVWTVLLLTGVFALLAGVYAALSARERSRRKVNGFFARVGRTAYLHKFAYIGLLPTFLLLAIFYWYPILQSLFVSLFDYLPKERLQFVGFENFRLVFMNAEFWNSFQNTLVFLVTDLAKAIIPPVLFAEFLLALRSKRTSYAIRVLLFVPGILPGVASMLVWADGIFGASSSGLLNGFLQALLPSWASRAWLMNSKTALVSLIFMNFPWVGSYLIFFGAISGVNKEIYEAAKVDGCGWCRRMLRIDAPLILPQIKYVFIQTFISSVQNYTLILITTGGDYGTNTPALMMYNAMVVQRNYGLASAMGVILLIFLMAATIINFKMQLGNSRRIA